MFWLVGTLAGLGLSALSFLFGKMFAQSEKVLDQKRRIYEDFLKVCPSPNEAHATDEPELVALQRMVGIISLYGSRDMLTAAGEYIVAFGKAQPLLQGVTEAGHPEFMTLMTSYNRMIWAMRNDVMMWSYFAPPKSSREYRPSWTPELEK